MSTDRRKGQGRLIKSVVKKLQIWKCDIMEKLPFLNDETTYVPYLSSLDIKHYLKFEIWEYLNFDVAPNLMACDDSGLVMHFVNFR